MDASVSVPTRPVAVPVKVGFAEPTVRVRLEAFTCKAFLPTATDLATGGAA